jgi:hypothetical protein
VDYTDVVCWGFEVVFLELCCYWWWYCPLMNDVISDLRFFRVCKNICSGCWIFPSLWLLVLIYNQNLGFSCSFVVLQKCSFNVWISGFLDWGKRQWRAWSVTPWFSKINWFLIFFLINLW